VVAIAAAACLLFDRYRIFFYVGDALAVLAALCADATWRFGWRERYVLLLRWLRPVEGHSRPIVCCKRLAGRRARWRR